MDDLGRIGVAVALDLAADHAHGAGRVGALQVRAVALEPHQGDEAGLVEGADAPGGAGAGGALVRVDGKGEGLGLALAAVAAVAGRRRIRDWGLRNSTSRASGPASRSSRGATRGPTPFSDVTGAKRGKRASGRIGGSIGQAG